MVIKHCWKNLLKKNSVMVIAAGHIDDKKEFVDKLTNGSSDFVTIDLSEQTISISDKVAIVRHTLNAKTNDWR
jgi:hypothetical protein